MGMTMTQKILAAHAGLEQVQAGQLILADLDVQQTIRVGADDGVAAVIARKREQLVEKLPREDAGIASLTIVRRADDI